MTREALPCPWCDTMMEYHEETVSYHCPNPAHKGKEVLLLNWDGKPMSEEERDRYWNETG